MLRPTPPVDFSQTTRNDAQWKNWYLRKFKTCTYPPTEDVARAARRRGDRNEDGSFRSESPTHRPPVSARDIEAAGNLRAQAQHIDARKARHAHKRSSAGPKTLPAARNDVPTISVEQPHRDDALFEIWNGGEDEDEPEDFDDESDPDQHGDEGRERSARRRVLAGSHDDDFAMDDARQMSTAEKRARADLATNLPTHLSVSRPGPWSLPEPRTWRDLGRMRTRYPCIAFDRLLTDGSLLGLQYVALFTAIASEYWAARFTASAQTASQAFTRLLKDHPRLLDAIVIASEREAQIRDMLIQARNAKDEREGFRPSKDQSVLGVTGALPASRTGGGETPRHALWGALKRVIKETPMMLLTAGQGGRRGAASGESNSHPTVTVSSPRSHADEGSHTRTAQLPRLGTTIGGPGAGTLSRLASRKGTMKKKKKTEYGKQPKSPLKADSESTKSSGPSARSSVGTAVEGLSPSRGHPKGAPELAALYGIDVANIESDGDSSSDAGSKSSDDAAPNSAFGSDGSVSPNTFKRKNSIFKVNAMPSFTRQGTMMRGGGKPAGPVSSMNNGVRPEVHLKRALQQRAEASSHAGFIAAVDDAILVLEARTDRTVELLSLALHELLAKVQLSEAQCDGFFTLRRPPAAYLCTELAFTDADAAAAKAEDVPPQSSSAAAGEPPTRQRESPSIRATVASAAIREEKDTNSEVVRDAAVPELEEPHPLLLPLQILDSYWDLHCSAAIVAMLAPVVELMADPQFRLYDLEVVRRDLDVHMPASKANVASTQPGAATGKPPTPPESPAAFGPAPPRSRGGKHRGHHLKNAAEAIVASNKMTRVGDRSAVEARTTGNILRALNMVTARLSSLDDAGKVDPDAMPQDAGRWLPAGARYLTGLISTLIAQRVLALVASVEGGGSASTTATSNSSQAALRSNRNLAFAERFGLLRRHPSGKSSDADRAAHTDETSGAAAVPRTLESLLEAASLDKPVDFGAGIGDPSMFPRVFFPLSDVVERFEKAQNPLVVGLVRCRVQRHIVIERMLVRYLSEPTRYDLFPPAVSTLAPGHPTHRHLQRNCAALAYYLYCASAGLPVTSFFTVEVDETPNTWKLANSTTAGLGLPVSIQPLTRMPVLPCRLRRLLPESAAKLDFRSDEQAKIPAAVRVAQWAYDCPSTALTAKPTLPAPAERFRALIRMGAGSPLMQNLTTPAGVDRKAHFLDRARWVPAIATACHEDDGSAHHITFLLEHFALMVTSTHMALEPPPPIRSVDHLLEAARSAPQLQAEAALHSSHVATGLSRWVKRSVTAASVSKSQYCKWTTSTAEIAEMVVPHSVIAAATTNLLEIVRKHQTDFQDALAASASRVVPRKVRPPPMAMLTPKGGGHDDGSLPSSSNRFDHSTVFGRPEPSPALSARPATGGFLALPGPRVGSSPATFMTSIVSVDEIPPPLSAMSMTLRTLSNMHSKAARAQAEAALHAHQKVIDEFYEERVERMVHRVDHVLVECGISAERSFDLVMTKTLIAAGVVVAGRGRRAKRQSSVAEQEAEDPVTPP